MSMAWSTVGSAVIGGVGSYMSAKEAGKNSGGGVQQTEPATITRLKQLLGEKGVDVANLITPEMFQGTQEDIPIGDIRTEASGAETAVNDDVIARIMSGTGLSEEELALREQVRIDEDARFSGSISDMASQLAFAGKKAGVTTGGQLGSLQDYLGEATQTRAEEATKYKLGTVSEDFARMNEILGRGLGVGTLSASREGQNTTNAFNEYLQRRQRPYQLAQLPASYAQAGGSAAQQSPTSQGSSPIGSAITGGLTGALIGKYLGNNNTSSGSGYSANGYSANGYSASGSIG